MEKEEIEKIARKMFPIGTKFCPAHLTVKKGLDEYCVNTNNKFKWRNNDLFITLDKGGFWQNTENTTKYGNTCYNRMVYEDHSKKYAIVIEKGKLINNIYELW